ncbi:phospholipase C [Gluconobacter kondonii]|uniref:phospholipase C n=1 Tax=Gluconobacter kondonii TaxID=941463 RepID=UPI00197CEDF4|nr:alkaline phosphatase family protein [Gluconobacter kondonii]MBS1077812.1 alkaline phosphatase family protein [Gluconobacter kondonii]
MTNLPLRLPVAAIGLCLMWPLATHAADTTPPTRTPIKHLVVIYQENVSFDHYFGTYPKAANLAGEPEFHPSADTPRVDTLATADLLRHNPNTILANGRDASLPFRLDRTQAATADQNHGYTAEQRAYDHGRSDLFPRYTGRGLPGGVGAFGTRGEVMGYFDGNTVTAIWRYAQRFAMSDATYTDTYGPSTPGALEVVSGQTNGLQIKTTTQKPSTLHAASPYVGDGQGGWTMINDIDPADDVCSTPNNQVRMTGPNIGDLLNRHGITWGGFMGGFNLSIHNPDGSTGCQRQTLSPTVSQTVADYIPHHNWFQYYASTANPTHARPSSAAAIGHSMRPDNGQPDPANHEYDLQDFFAATKAGNLPAVSFVKMPAWQDAHAGYSDPLDEQKGVVELVNFIQTRPEWRDTAIFIAYDDSDGWYDHAFVPPRHGSADPEVDQLDGPGHCGTAARPKGVGGSEVNGRCGPGTRIPLLVLSPWARTNYVSHTFLTQSSIPRFIEDNWLQGERLGKGSFDADANSLEDLFDFSRKPRLDPLFLDAGTGTVKSQP